jgi:hypothetical protein
LGLGSNDSGNGNPLLDDESELNVVVAVVVAES